MDLTCSLKHSHKTIWSQTLLGHSLPLLSPCSELFGGGVFWGAHPSPGYMKVGCQWLTDASLSGEVPWLEGAALGQKSLRGFPAPDSHPSRECQPTANHCQPRSEKPDILDSHDTAWQLSLKLQISLQLKPHLFLAVLILPCFPHFFTGFSGHSLDS